MTWAPASVRPKNPLCVVRTASCVEQKILTQYAVRTTQYEARPWDKPTVFVLYYPPNRRSAMRAWQALVLIGVCGMVGMTGCAKKESNFEQAGKKLDSALSDMNRDMNRAVKK